MPTLCRTLLPSRDLSLCPHKLTIATQRRGGDGVGAALGSAATSAGQRYTSWCDLAGDRGDQGAVSISAGVGRLISGHPAWAAHMAVVAASIE
jgi:hypothetical protein